MRLQGGPRATVGTPRSHHKASGSVYVPSAVPWQTPGQGGAGFARSTQHSGQESQAPRGSPGQTRPCPAPRQTTPGPGQALASPGGALPAERDTLLLGPSPPTHTATHKATSSDLLGSRSAISLGHNACLELLRAWSPAAPLAVVGRRWGWAGGGSFQEDRKGKVVGWVGREPARRWQNLGRMEGLRGDQVVDL